MIINTHVMIYIIIMILYILSLTGFYGIKYLKSIKKKDTEICDKFLLREKKFQEALEKKLNKKLKQENKQ